MVKLAHRFPIHWEGSRLRILTRIPIKYFLQLSYEKTGSVRSAGIRKTRAGLPFFRLEPASLARADDLTTGRLRSQQLEVFFFHSSSSLSPALQLYKLSSVFTPSYLY